MVDFTKGKKEQIIETEFYASCFAYNKGVFYYADSLNDVYAYDIAEKRSLKLNIASCKQIYFLNNELYFVNFENKIETYNFETALSEVISEIKIAPTSYLTANETHLFFVNDSGEVVSIDIKTRQSKVISTERAYNVVAFDSSKIHIFHSDGMGFRWSFLELR